MDTPQTKTATQQPGTPFAERKPFGAPAGSAGKKRPKAASEYKKSLTEKQTLKRLYGLSERQFKKYVLEALDKMGKVENISEELIKRLETRLDSVVFRLGFAKSRPHARQLVVHSYFSINGRTVNIPSYTVKKTDIIALKETKKKKEMFKGLSEQIKKHEVPAWLSLDKTKMEAKAKGEPSLAEAKPPAEISLIFEFYSR